MDICHFGKLQKVIFIDQETPICNIFIGVSKKNPSVLSKATAVDQLAQLLQNFIYFFGYFSAYVKRIAVKIVIKCFTQSMTLI